MVEKKQTENEDLPDKEKKKAVPLFDEDIKNHLEKIKEHHEDLDNQIEQIYHTSGLTPQKITDYLENQANFTELEWERVQRLKKHFENQLLSLLGPGHEKQQKIEEKFKSKKKLRGRAIGKRKKWIEMD